MKILAIEIEIEGVSWNSTQELLKEEAKHVFNLQNQNILREIYFNEEKCAVLIMECKNKTEAKEIISNFPLVKNNYIRFEVQELTPYTGLERLFKD